ncbi:endonuclease domain-containing protein [Candidatus Kryptobacter tengchongensis]|nr:endonuclease domain-containing protein [Candidatus Kryptobacter tengchongensis]
MSKIKPIISKMNKKQIIEIARQLRKQQTPAEKKLWDVLRNRKFLGLKFLRQHPIIYGDGNKLRFFIADFYCAEKKIIIEIDGKVHNYQKDRDQIRDSITNSLGLKILRIKNEELTRLELVLEKIENFVKSN